MIQNIRDSSRLIVRELGLLDATCCGEELSNAEVHALIELETGIPLSIKEISTRLNLKQSTSSRLISLLVKKGLGKSRPGETDKRSRAISLTSKGKAVLQRVHQTADKRVSDALNELSESDQSKIVAGLKLYAQALERSRKRAGLEIRPVKKSDNPTVASIIRTVMTEFGATSRGFAIHDPEVDSIFQTYNNKRALYLVVTHNGTVVGGGGIQQLKGGAPDTCELQKMYFLPTVRGLGLGKTLLTQLLDEAKRMGFKQCYLETTGTMYQARGLYESLGFERLQAPMGSTGHTACEGWYLKKFHA